jgi:hypothetical protein
VPEEPKEIDVGDMTVDERIKVAVSKYPNFGAWQIKKILNTSDFHYTHLGWFEIRKKLKELGLHTKENRYNYSAKQK